MGGPRMAVMLAKQHGKSRQAIEALLGKSAVGAFIHFADESGFLHDLYHNQKYGVDTEFGWGTYIGVLP